MLWRHTIPALLGCALLASAAAAQQPPPRRPDTAPRLFEIKGWVRHAADQSTLEQVQVELRRFSGEVVATAFTGSSGTFEFLGVPPGEYYLWVSERGFEPVRERIEVFNSSRLGVQLYLQRPMEFTTETAAPTVDVRELSLPRRARDAFRRGLDRLYKRRDPGGSLRHFARALEEFPEYYEAQHETALAYLEMGRDAEARAAFLRALEMSEQTYAPAFFGLAGLSNSSEDFDQAVRWARQGLARDAEAWQGHFELARALLGLGRPFEAEIGLRETVRRNPAFSPAYLLLANLCIRRQDLDGLVKNLDAYLELEPRGPQSGKAKKMREQALRQLREQESESAASPRP